MAGTHEIIDMSRVRPRSGGRDISKENVKQLVASMGAIGLLQPITVIKARVMNGPSMVDGYEVIAGRHRYCAAIELKWKEVPAIVLDVDADIQHIELIEIDENLCRAELTAAQRASHIKRRKEIWVAMHPETGGTNCPTSLSDGRKAGPQHEQGFAAETAAVSGESKRDVNRHIARAEALGDDINEVVGTSLDKGVELDALAKKPEQERKELIERAKAGEKVSARDESAPEKARPDHITERDVTRFAVMLGGFADAVDAEIGFDIDALIDAAQKSVEALHPNTLRLIAGTEKAFYLLYLLSQTAQEALGG